MTYTKNVVDSTIREDVFGVLEIEQIEGFKKINDRQMGGLVTDLNGHQRYVRIGVIVAEEREDMTAEELMQSEIAKYQEAQAKKAELAAKRAKKAASDAEKRKKAEEAKEKEEA